MLKEIKKLTTSESPKDNDLLSNPAYVCLASTVITDALKNGSDVMQLPSGDIIVTEYKAVTMCYSWSEEKRKLTKQVHKISAENARSYA